ncbi:MAG: ABC transporter permease [Deltaproteobacteria bacterium]|nr:ABC transporter permease [Candidatus Anaeroferrophillus wilburensis]MBN2889347.1 ABC transporter permease [Deltaproteobacteria bacterium]
MTIHYLIYLLKTAYQNIRQHLVINLVSIVTISFSLVVFGVYSFAYLNLKKNITDWQADLQITAFLQDSATRQQQQSLEDFCRHLSGVERVTYVSKQEALARFRRMLGQKDAALLAGVEENPLPASLELQLDKKLQEAGVVEALADQIAAQEGIEEVQYGQRWLRKFFSVVRLIHVFGVVVTGFLFFVTIMIVSNTIKLSFYSRQDTVDIMELVGATRFYIAIPYLLEGVFQGVIASLLALGMVYGIYRYLVYWLQSHLYFLEGVISLTFFPPFLLGGFVVLGILLGIVGFLVSFRWLKTT